MIGKLVWFAYASIACISGGRGGTRSSRYCCTNGGIGSAAIVALLLLFSCGLALGPCWNHADKAERLLAERLELMLLVRLNEHRVAHADLAPLLAEQHPPTAVGDHHAMLVRVALEGRVAAGRDGKVADDEVLGALVPADQHPPRRPGRRAA